MTSLQTQSKAPDIPSPSLHVSKQELSPRLNVQDQAPDIPGFSIRDAIAQYLASLQAQSKVPDIPSQSFLYILMVFHVNLVYHRLFSISCWQLSDKVIPHFLMSFMITHISSLVTLLNNPIWELCSLMFYGFELLVRVWSVSIVLVLVVPSLITCVSSLILPVILYISFCMYQFQREISFPDLLLFLFYCNKNKKLNVTPSLVLFPSCSD